MNIQTFEGQTMKDAIRQVKSVFGSDAIILETKEKFSENTGGRVFEVTASPGGAQKGAESGGSVGPSSKGMRISPTELIEWQQKLDSFENKISSIYEKSLKREHLISIESSIEEVRTLVVDYLSRKSDSTFRGVSEPVANIIKQLKVMSVNDTTVSGLVKHLKSVPEGKNEDLFEYYQKHAIRWLMKRIKISPKWSPMDGSTQLHIVVGPSGVGKSSMVAKLASYFKQKEDKNVIVVSFDNHRLGSTEQMRIYSKVIGTPFETIRSAGDLTRVLKKHRNADMILVDTGGRSPKNSEAIEELAELKELPVTPDFHLALSMTDQKTQVERVIRSFSKLGIASLLFTKMDESWSYGEVYNAMDKWGIPLGWFSIGYRIPEDIEKASRERVVERIMGI